MSDITLCDPILDSIQPPGVPYQYNVCGLPPGRKALIHRRTEDGLWEILLDNLPGRGAFETPEAARADLEKALTGVLRF